MANSVPFEASSRMEENEINAMSSGGAGGMQTICMVNRDMMGVFATR